ncbi:TetR/AcrR family transcriptional regulator [Aureibaculum sp. A20]|uniref:TetR/AcrR family transcriptional regulator n=1 Tax=Aureibaculum flavum TaxID=2795986 RepID=A0ABS0WW90_9FLAO|nr:TetR/AcrR family transcriptional regulator [Aureibaculum flavum]MBJ2176185.1 TetR/AcrR family transcriptional regulator [Aureibaculum flavum]
MKLKTKDSNTETDILNAAEVIFQRKGLDGARMQEIADEAGINKALLHYYFRSKQLLFETVFHKAFSLIAPQIKAILDDNSSIDDKIKNFTNNYIAFISEHPYLPNFIFQELNRNTDFISKVQKTIGFPTIDKFKKQLEREVKKGTIIPIKAEQLFINILALNIFPFLAKPLIKSITNTDENTFNHLMEERKTEVSNFIINAIKRK